MKTIQIRSFLILFFSLIAIAEISAQGNHRPVEDRYRDIEAQRVAFITRELSLTPEEAQVFWPVYNEYNVKKNQLMIRHHHQRSDDRNLNQLNDRELIELADADVNNLEEMASLRREYHIKFKQILPIIKVVQLYNSERDFNRRLYNERDRRPGGGRSN